MHVKFFSLELDYRITFLSTGENDKVHKGRLRRKITYAK